MSAPSDDPFAETRMSLGEHLDELRGRLFKGVLALAIAFFVVWGLREHVVGFALRPYDRAMAMLERQLVEEAEEVLAARPGRPRTDFFVTADPGDRRLLGFHKQALATKPGESFVFYLRVCLYAAVVFGAPVLLWQMWRFVGAGLYRHERRAVTRFFPISLGLFVLGVAFGFQVMVPYAMYFLNSDVSVEVIVPSIRLEDFLTFLSGLCLALGAVFQLPVLMSFLSMVGVVAPSTFARYRGHWIVGAFVIAAILTPPDPFTQTLLGLPMVVLYEIGIWSGRLATARARRAAERAAEGTA